MEAAAALCFTPGAFCCVLQGILRAPAWLGQEVLGHPGWRTRGDWPAAEK